MSQFSLTVSNSNNYDREYERELEDYLIFPGIVINNHADREQIVSIASDAKKYTKGVSGFFKVNREPFKRAMDEHRAMEKRELDVPMKFIDAAKKSIKEYDEKVEKDAAKAIVSGKSLSKIVQPAKGTKQSSTKFYNKALVVDIKKVCQHIANGDLSEDLVTFKESILNDLATQWGQSLDNKFPGLEYKKERSVSIG